MEQFRRIAEREGALLGVLAIGVIALLTYQVFLHNPAQPHPAPSPTPLPLRDYQIVFTDGTTVRTHGHFIRGGEGFCSEIWKDGVVDTVICQPHVLVDVTGLPEPTGTANSKEKEESLANGCT